MWFASHINRIRTEWVRPFSSRSRRNIESLYCILKGTDPLWPSICACCSPDQCEQDVDWSGTWPVCRDLTSWNYATSSCLWGICSFKSKWHFYADQLIESEWAAYFPDDNAVDTFSELTKHSIKHALYSSIFFFFIWWRHTLVSVKS